VNRRELVALLGGVVAWPLDALAQETGRTYRVAYLGPSPQGAPPQAAFLEALGKLGFIAGRNLEVDVRGFGQGPAQFVQTRRSCSRLSPI